jgi:hypothetical protein
LEKSMPKSEEAPHLRVRLKPQLIARLEKARKKIGRTMTGEIEWRLEQSFQREEQEEWELRAKQLATAAATTAVDQVLERFQRPGGGLPVVGWSAQPADGAKPADSKPKDKP